MHCIEVIVARNERAAGREAGHAHNDNDLDLRDQIIGAAEVTNQFADGFIAAGQEG